MDDSAEGEFREFVDGRWTWLARFAYGLTGDSGLAEDLAQTALANAYAAWSRVRRADDQDAYLRRIVLNAHRASFRKPRVKEELTGTPEYQAGSAGPDPARQNEDRDVVISALLTLPVRQREVVVLRYLLDLTDSQVAATLQCSVGNVRSQASRALAKLRSSAELADWRAGA